MKDIQEKICNFLEDESNYDENFENLETIINNTKIRDKKHDFLLLLHLILKIGNNHFRNSDFFNKIDRILQIFKEDITKYYSNYEIFNIFKSNKRILLFLIEQKLIKFDETIVKKILMTDKYITIGYLQYFQPEIQPFINEKWFSKDSRTKKLVEELKKELPENFYEKRKKGENDSKICELVRNNMIQKFIAYIVQNDISNDAMIQSSIYETNSLLLQKQIECERFKFHKNQNENYACTLIEYAAFCGSIQIFNYLQINKAKLMTSLLLFSIHGENSEIIRFLIDNLDNLNDDLYKRCFYESIKCHHNNIAHYLLNNIIQVNENNQQNAINQGLKNYNFAFIENELINESFCNLCKYNYYTLVDYILKNKDIDINMYVFFKYFIKFKIRSFNSIQKYSFSIAFKIFF